MVYLIFFSSLIIKRQKAFIHYSKDNAPWTELPGDLMEQSRNLSLPEKEWKCISFTGKNKLEFTF